MTRSFVIYYCSGQPRPMTTSFTLTRKRKVELSSVSAPLDEATLQNLAARRDSTVSEQCLAGGGKLLLMISVVIIIYLL